MPPEPTTYLQGPWGSLCRSASLATVMCGALQRRLWAGRVPSRPLCQDGSTATCPPSWRTPPTLTFCRSALRHIRVHTLQCEIYCSALPAVHGTSQCITGVAVSVTNSSAGCHWLSKWPLCDMLAHHQVKSVQPGPLSIILCLVLSPGSICAQVLDAMAAMDAKQGLGNGAATPWQLHSRERERERQGEHLEPKLSVLVDIGHPCRSLWACIMQPC